MMIVTIALTTGREIHVIHANKGRYHLKEFKIRFGKIVVGLKTQLFIGRYWSPLLLIRWAATIIIMVFLKENCIAQIIVLLLISVIFQILLAIANPMIDKSDRRLTWIIEVSVSIYLYVSIHTHSHAHTQ